MKAIARKVENQIDRNFQSNDLVTEDQSALEFARLYKGRLRFCHSTGAWFEWTGARWKVNRTGLAFTYARELARRLAASEADKVRYISSKVSFAAGVEKFARCDPAFAVTIEAWDSDPMLLGTPNGTVDLRTGRLRPSDPAEGITKSTAVAPADRADCARWRAFLNEATGGDAEFVRFLQQWAGYSLTGRTDEHALLLIHGGGGEGKSTFIKALTDILGDYATIAAMDTFTASRSDKHPADLAMLRGARLVCASETEEGRAWAEARIKSITGGDPVTARFMRQDFFTFLPQFKLTIVGNHRPALHNVDEAMRRRLNLVPFTRKPKNPDPLLGDKLKAEAPGILRWAIEGCLDWQQNGLNRPTVVKAETDDYFNEQDTFRQWLAEECECDRGNRWKTATSGELFASWRAYAFAANEPIGSQKAFSDRMTKAGFAKRKGSKGVRLFEGIRFIPQEGVAGGS
jgi:putative DNA primase/helicase